MNKQLGGTLYGSKSLRVSRTLSCSVAISSHENILKIDIMMCFHMGSA
jgi:hypothetical protein